MDGARKPYFTLISASILKFEDCWSKERTKAFAYRSRFFFFKHLGTAQVKFATPVEYIKTCLGYEIWIN